MNTPTKEKYRKFNFWIFGMSFFVVMLINQCRTAHAVQSTIQANLRGHIEYMPPLVNGDREFGGNGPDVQVSVKFFVENGLVKAQLWMYARETKSDWTTARGLSPKQVVYRPQSGFRVVRRVEDR